VTEQERVERLILGACLDGSDTVDFACRWIPGPDYFSLDSHKRIFLKIRQMQQRKAPINISTLLIEFGGMKELEAVGGAAYVTDLSDGVPNGMGPRLREYVNRLKESYRVRMLHLVAERIQLQESSADIMQGIQDCMDVISESSADTNALRSFADFVSATPNRVDWMLEGIIERGANGFIAAEPKGSKSFVTADLAIALATGTPWLDFPVPRPVRVALVSREDNPSLTAWRLKHLMQGRNLNAVQLNLLEQNLYINTKAETPSFMLDNENDVAELIGACRARKTEFILLDVLNVLHRADENDNTQMAAVLHKVKRLTQATGAATGILHHYKKEESGRITQRLRGASAIAGFAEWVIGISMSDEEAKIRRMDFELKAGCPPDSVYFVINAQEEQPAKIQRMRLQTQGKQLRAQKSVN
jgi:hypothetical protein